MTVPTAVSCGRYRKTLGTPFHLKTISRSKLIKALMKHYSRFGLMLLPALFAASILTGFLNHSTASKAIEAVQDSKLGSPIPKKSQIVVLNGIQFQVITSDHEIKEKSDVVSQQHFFALPKPVDPLQYPEGVKPLYIAVHITNRTNKPVYFGRFGYIKPTFINAEGKVIEGSLSGKGFNPKDYGSVLISPGKSINFVSQGVITWENGSLQLSFSGCPGCNTLFDKIEPGNYQLQITYSNYTDEVDSGMSRFTGEPPKLERVVWKGEVKLPLVELQLGR